MNESSSDIKDLYGILKAKLTTLSVPRGFNASQSLVDTIYDYSLQSIENVWNGY